MRSAIREQRRQPETTIDAAAPKRLLVSWVEARARSELLEISIEDLAAWAAENVPLQALGSGALHRPAAAELATAMARNPHLFQRLALQYARAQTAARESRASR